MGFSRGHCLIVILVVAIIMFGIHFLFAFFISPDDYDDANLLWKAKYTPNSYSVHITTWNVGNGKPFKNDLLPLLGINDTFKPDIIAFGVQEVIKVGANLNTFVGKIDWRSEISDVLTNEEYLMVDWLRNMAMNLFVFVHKDHSSAVLGFNNVQTKTNPELLPMHKGGQTIRISFYNTHVTFTNSHLAAGETMAELDKRRDNYYQVLHSEFNNGQKIYENTYHFWFGDLNFRINNLDKDEIFSLIDQIKNSSDSKIKQERIDELVDNDELTNDIRKGRAFSDYEEPKITFPPTYKFFPHTLTYTRQRKPAYCDRILVRKPFDKLEYLNVKYTSNPNYLMSDHLPVQGLFYIKA